MTSCVSVCAGADDACGFETAVQGLRGRGSGAWKGFRLAAPMQTPTRNTCTLPGFQRLLGCARMFCVPACLCARGLTTPAVVCMSACECVRECV